MADNITLNGGTGGSILATDDITSVHYQRVKVTWGADGTANDTSAANPIPVTTPDDPFGLNADAAVAAGDAGSMQAKLRRLTTDLDALLQKLPATAAMADAKSNPTNSNIASMLMGFNGTTWDRLRSDTTNGLDVDVTRVQGTVTVSGTVTADAGTNLNTSTLALESGGNLATLAGAVTGTEMQCDVITQPARAATADNVGAALMTNVLHDGTTALTPKYAAIDAASSGDNTLVSAVVGKKIRVISLFIVAGGDVLARLENGAGGTALTGQMDLTTNSGFTLNFNPVGWFETSANTLLNLELDGAVTCDGCLTYVEV